MRRWISLLGAALAASCATATPIAHAPHDSPAWPMLTRFSDERAFLEYVEAAAEARRARVAALHSSRKQSVAEPELCPPDDPGCAQEDSVVVTSARVARQNLSSINPITTISGESITNVQTAGVDEGDIVKLIGRFLIVLQDGRLFSVDTGASADDLAFVDRIDVYRNSDADTWYDEMLVHENRILVTGFSYGEDATEYSVFSLGEDGRFMRESVYYLSSDDYYDTENYATRLVNGALVIYTPLDVSNFGQGRRVEWPLVRRWLRDGEYETQMSDGRRLFDGGDIYRPIQSTLEPTVHTISVCPLGGPQSGDELDCRSTAITGPGRREFYVSNDHVYLWLGSDGNDFSRDSDRRCEAKGENAFTRANEAALFQISLRDGRPEALFVRGLPYDQMSMEATGSAFRSLAVWLNENCDDYPEDLPLRFFSTPLTAFSARPHAAPEAHFTPLPGPGGRALENRFASGYLIYGGRERWGSYPPSDAENLHARVVAVPTDTPSAAMVLEAPHNIIRVESIGVRAVLTGYRNDDALSLSVLDLQGAPRFTATAELSGRYESEGRSHAFNAAPDEHGAGLLGLPTVQVRRGAGRWWWNSESSDVSFLSVDREGAITTLGELTSDAAENTDPSYRCEVSCIDWYGNSRPIFVRGRVFALSGTELIEGKVEDGRIGEIGRVNLTASSPRPSKAR